MTSRMVWFRALKPWARNQEIATMSEEDSKDAEAPPHEAPLPTDREADGTRSRHLWWRTAAQLALAACVPSA
jgi:hypothetical protein